MSHPLTVPPGNTAQRPRWLDLPSAVRASIEHACGSTVQSATSHGSGYTPGFASTLRLLDGRSVFVKATNSTRPWLAEAYRAEAELVVLLPVGLSVPRLQHVVQLTVAEVDWWVLLFDAVDGRPPRRPWVASEVDQVLRATKELSTALTPAPAGLAWDEFTSDLAPYVDLHYDHIVQAGLLVDIRDDARRLAEGAATLDGDTLVHHDLRDDNILLDAGGRVWFCDWNFPTTGPIWADTLSLLLSMSGDGHDGDRLLADSGLVRDSDRDQVDGLLALLLGYFSFAGAQPAPADSPYLRPPQRWYAQVSEDWLRARRGWR
ncbi:MAG: phosphotransferase [Propionibacteriaceae bacterium]